MAQCLFFSLHTSHSLTQIASTTLLFEGENAGGPAVTKDLKIEKYD